MDSIPEAPEMPKSSGSALSETPAVKPEPPANNASVTVKEQICGFVRIKRRADEDPATKLLLSFKRQKLVGGTEVEHVESVLKFAGSIEGDHKLEMFIKDFEAKGHDQPSKRSKLHPRNIRKLKELFSPAAAKDVKREDVQKQSTIRRCKIVSAHRGIDPDEILKSASPGNYTMFDLVDDKVTSAASGDDVITVNGVPMEPVQDEPSPSKKPEGLKTYVYDLYALPAPINHEDFVNVERQWDSDDFVYDDKDSDEEKPVTGDDEDSNDENNPNYDYPEEVSDDNSGSDVDHAAGYYDEDDDSDNAAAWVNGSKGMKELSNHMNTMNLGSKARKNPAYCDEDFFDDDDDDEEF